MSSDSLRGNRLGSESQENTRGVTLSPRQTTEYVCPSEHITEIIFAAEAEIPAVWDCKTCYKPAKLKDSAEVEEIDDLKTPKTHFEQLLERRSREDLEIILKEAIADLRKRRKKAS